MGLSNSPDIFQEHMSELMGEPESKKVCIDDVIALSIDTSMFSNAN